MLYEDVEAHAKLMKLIGTGEQMKNRKMSIPLKISNDTTHVFGIKSALLNQGNTKGNPSNLKDPHETASNIKSIFQHSDNIRNSLERKIKQKIEFEQVRKHKMRTVMDTIATTKTSELRS